MNLNRQNILEKINKQKLNQAYQGIKSGQVDDEGLWSYLRVDGIDLSERVKLGMIGRQLTEPYQTN